MTWEMQTSIYYLIVLLQFDPEVDISTPSIGLLAQIWELINDWAAYLVSMEYFELNFKRNCVSDPWNRFMLIQRHNVLIPFLQ